MSDSKKNRVGMRPKTSDASKKKKKDPVNRVLYVGPTGKRTMRTLNVHGEMQ